MTASGPSSTWLAVDSHERTRPSRSTTPAASFVPPTSRPRTSGPGEVAENGVPVFWPCLVSARLPLPTGRCDALHEVSLTEEEDDDHRQSNDDGGGHDVLHVALAAGRDVLLGDEELKPARQREEVDVAQVDQGLHQIGPRRLELEHEDDD